MKKKVLTKKIWEMEPGDIGRLRDKDKTLIIATDSPGGWCCWTATKQINYIQLNTISKNGVINPGVWNKLFCRLKDYTVDLLPFQLT